MQVFRIIDWMMTLPLDLKRELREEIRVFEETKQMPLLSSYELMAREAGIEIGKQAGIEIGKQVLVRTLLSKGFTLEQIADMTNMSLEVLQRNLDPNE